MRLFKIFKNKLFPHFPLLFVAFFAINFFAKYILLADGSVLDRYPYISVDGYEWYTNGVYLYESLAGRFNQLPLITVLRPPVYVVLAALDYGIGENGIIIGLAASICIVTSYLAASKLCFHKCANLRVDNIFIGWCLALAFTFSPINFIRPYILADTLATALSILSICILKKFFESNHIHYLIVASLLSGLSALTQTYGFIPFAIYTTSQLAFIWRKQSNKYRATVLGCLTITAIAAFLASYYWRLYMPHLTTPDNFNFFEFSLKNLNFYKNTWAFVLWPVILVFLTSLVNHRFRVAINSFQISIILICITFGILSFFYQWKESRFTFLLWPWIIIFTLSTASQLNKFSQYLIVSIFIVSTFIIPINYWMPEFNGSKITFKNWMYDFLKSDPIDRKLKHCSGIKCQANIICDDKCPENKYFDDFDRLSNGTGRTLSTYLFLKNH